MREHKTSRNRLHPIKPYKSTWSAGLVPEEFKQVKEKPKKREKQNKDRKE